MGSPCCPAVISRDISLDLAPFNGNENKQGNWQRGTSLARQQKEPGRIFTPSGLHIEEFGGRNPFVEASIFWLENACMQVLWLSNFADRQIEEITKRWLDKSPNCRK